MKIRLLDLAGAAEELFEPAVRGGGIESSPMGPFLRNRTKHKKALLRCEGPRKKPQPVYEEAAAGTLFSGLQRFLYSRRSGMLSLR